MMKMMTMMIMMIMVMTMICATLMKMIWMCKPISESLDVQFLGHLSSLFGNDDDDDDGSGHDDDDKDKVQSNQRHNFLGHIPRPFGSKGSEAIRAAESQKWEQRNIGIQAPCGLKPFQSWHRRKNGNKETW